MSVLIVGGSGSFGTAFARRCLDDGVGRVCIFSRNEHRQADMRQEFGNDPRLRFFIGDVRDQSRLRRAMEGIDLVVLAAALKRIEVGTYCADEMVKTNIYGAMNVIDAAHDSGVQKVVALSTDKAWRGGISPYGHTKALMESIVIQANEMRSGTRYAAVRYGNIWKSNGSIVPTWLKLIKAGAKEVPVRDPDCTRFFMRLSEAVSLVSDTLKSMRGGELVIPETLPAYRVADLAEAMCVKMKVLGLPAWERKHEGMRDGLTSDIVRRLTVNELREYIHDETN